MNSSINDSSCATSTNSTAASTTVDETSNAQPSGGLGGWASQGKGKR